MCTKGLTHLHIQKSLKNYNSVTLKEIRLHVGSLGVHSEMIFCSGGQNNADGSSACWIMCREVKISLLAGFMYSKCSCAVRQGKFHPLFILSNQMFYYGYISLASTGIVIPAR
jgi:hypothetical protein